MVDGLAKMDQPAEREQNKECYASVEIDIVSVQIGLWIETIEI